MTFLVVFGGLLLVLIVLWIFWSAFDKAVPPQLFYSRSTFTRSVLDHCPVLQSPYVPTWFWGKSGHIQTILYGKMGRVFSPRPCGSRCSKLLADGATMSYDIFQPLGSLETDGCATLLVCPGIANSSETIYIRTFVYHAQQNGFRIAVLNHFGALAGVTLTAPRLYTYGGTDEYGLMVDEMRRKYPDSKFIAVGFSMGANIVVKYLGEHEEAQTWFIGAISCCQGYSLVECTPLLLQWRSGRYFYIRAMTEHQKRILRRHEKVLFGDEAVRRYGSFDVDKIFSALTLLDIDFHYSHKRAGFKSCEEYYQWSSCCHHIHKVNIPMLLLNAMDDPIVPSELHHIPRRFALKRDNVIFAVTHHGGHLGYFEGGIVLPNSVTWLDRIIVEFSSALLHCKTTTNQQQCQMCTASNFYSNCEPSAKKLPSADDASDDDDVTDLQQQKKQDVERSTLPTTAYSKADSVDKLAAIVVADILRESASVVYGDTEDAVENGTLANNDNVVTTKSSH